MLKKLLIAATLLLTASGFVLAHRSNQEAGKQAKAILAADVSSQNVTPLLNTLQGFVAAHMGSGATITLTGSHDRAMAAAKAAAQAQSANSQIYAQAQAACGGKNDSVSAAKCNQDFLAKHLVNVPVPAPVVEPKLADYQHQFRAPPWTPDLAGALFLGAAGALAILLLSLIKRRS